MSDLERQLLDHLAEIIAADILRQRERQAAKGWTA